jgi:PEP-CTERM motif
VKRREFIVGLSGVAAWPVVARGQQSNYTIGLLANPVAQGVPEPSTWAMMLLGFAGLGFAFRHGARCRSPKLRATRKSRRDPL